MADEQACATRALLSHSDGDHAAAAELVPVVYARLRALAAHYMRRERPDHTLQPTALVHEAYVRLVDRSRVDWRGTTHFFAVAATEMRRVLAEHARRCRARKRGGGAKKLALDDTFGVSAGGALDMLALDEALRKLAHRSPRQSRVVELRFFGGLTLAETAHVLDVSSGTVKGDWRVARAWLARELAGAVERDGEPPPP